MLLKCFTSVLPSVQDIFRRIFLSNCWWQKSDIWQQASYRYTILCVAFLNPSDSYFLFADLVGFCTYWTYMQIFRHIFLSNYWRQKSDIWSQASYRYPISWDAFLDPSDSCFLFANFVDFYAHWTYILYMPFFCCIFLSNYWWQKSDIWSQALYRYPISWEAFFNPSDSYFLFAEERGYHKWALDHSSSCFYLCFFSGREEWEGLPETWWLPCLVQVQEILHHQVMEWVPGWKCPEWKGHLIIEWMCHQVQCMKVMGQELIVQNLMALDLELTREV